MNATTQNSSDHIKPNLSKQSKLAHKKMELETRRNTFKNSSRINQMTKIFETVDISRFLHITYLEILRSSRFLNIIYLKM